ncbi:MAG: amidohydrolase family protein [Acidimicrobiales bacterium]
MTARLGGSAGVPGVGRDPGPARDDVDTAIRVVDAHVHIAVDELFAGPTPLDPSVAEVREVQGRRRLFTGGKELTSVVGELFDPRAMLQDARAHGIDHLLLSPWVQLLPNGLAVREARRRCEVQCEALAAVVASDPGHISAVGAVPIDHPREAVSALRAACAAGLAGVEVAASCADYLGDDSLERLWSAAEELGAVVFVHPATRGIPLHALDRHYLWNTVGNPMETAIAAAHLTMNGVLERHPGLVVLLAHGGGALSAVRGRMAHGQMSVPASRGRLSEPVERSLGRFYFDTVTHDQRQLERLIEDFGATRVLLGSDRPFDMGDPDPVSSVRLLGLCGPDERAVLGGNAARLLRLGDHPRSAGAATGGE